MIESIPANKKKGISAHTLIYDEPATQIEIMTLADDKGGEVVSCDDVQDYGPYRFGPNAGLIVVQMAPGRWQCESSTDGTKFKKQWGLWLSTAAHLFAHSIEIDGVNLVQKMWYRWTRQK